jgi:SNF2 family DNA or RNA helicase
MPWEAIGNITLVLTPKHGKDINPSGLHFDDVHFFPKSLGTIVNKLFLYEHRVSSNPVVRLETHTSVTQINSEIVKGRMRAVMRASEEGGGGEGEDLLLYEDCIRGDTESKDHPNPSKDIAYIRYTVSLNQRITGGSYISVAGWSLFQHVFSDLMMFITLKNMGRGAFQEYRRMAAESGENASCSWAIESENVFYGDQAGEDTVHSMMDRFDRFTTEKPAPEDLNVGNYLSVQLRKYQKRSLRFCMDVESEAKTLWIQVCQEPPLHFSPYFVQFSPHRGKNPTGGFLCDEMGLGKTVVSLALIMARPPPDNTYGNTLIVVPVSLVGQWVREAKKHIPELSHDDVYLHHGQSRITHRPTIASKKIVVTTYGIVSKEANFRTASLGDARRGSLEDIHWHRVIFDESHVLKNHNTLQYRAAKALKSNHKWCVTGTPLTYDNQIRSQMGLVTNAFDKVAMNRHCGLVDPLLSILSHYMIRHRKTMVIDGRPIVELPGCATHDVPVEMSEQERLRYIEARNATVARLPFMVGLSAFREIQNVRRLISNAVYQVGSGPNTISSCTEEEREVAEQRIAEDHCAVCLDIYDAPTMLRCSHVFCFQCIHHVLANGHPRCPLCRHPFDRSSMRLVHSVLDNNNAPSVRFQTKVQKTLELIRGRPQEKCLVFFHFQQSLDDFGDILHRAKVDFCQLNSSMAQRAREKALSRFENDPAIRVFLLSVRSSAVGINMTGASHIILFDPFMNKALEKQSIGRCWRLGQTREVTVERLYYANTLEEKILRDTTALDSTNNNNNTWNVMNIRQLLE